MHVPVARSSQPQSHVLGPAFARQPLFLGRRFVRCPSFTSQKARLSCRAADSSYGDIEYVVPPRDGKLESTGLRDSLRQQAQSAIEQLGGRVTIGDVAARAGVKVFEAEQALNALAADCNASIQVSESGDAVYVFPPNFAGIIQQRSTWLRIAPFIDRIKKFGGLLVRVGFGAALVASVALVWIAIFALITASSQDNRDRDRGGYRGGGYGNAGGYGGGFYYTRSPFIWWDASDLLLLQGRRPRKPKNAPMSFLESIYSFVFGDGDPNQDYEERRWQMVGRYIQSRGGVVAAEELAPFLDPPTKTGDDEVEESYVVPALVRFGGSPEVDEQGNLVYRFEGLQKSGGGKTAGPVEPAALQNLWEQTKATGGQKTGAIALGGFNVLGLAILGSWQGALTTLAQSNLAFLVSAFPYLTAYAASFFVIPAVRWALNQSRNTKIQQENRNRLERLRDLREPSPSLQRKLQSAQKQAKRRVIKDRDIIYRSDKNFDDQKDLDEAEFERRLNSGDSSKGRSFEDWAEMPQRDSQRDRSSEWRR